MLFDIPKSGSSIIKVIGVGGGGSNAVTHMFKQGIVGVDFAICNTDNQALDLSPIPVKIQLGPALTEGRGAGSYPNVGKQACLESIEEVKSYLLDGTKMLFVTAGMGGGTGTGAAPIIAKAARELDILTVGIVTLPFSFEGRKRSLQGLEGLEDLRENVDALVVISNDKLRTIYGNQTLSQAFSNADSVLTTAAKAIAEIITVAGHVNVDFADVNTVMRNSGVAIMGTATAEGDNRAKIAVDSALNSPLLEESNIRGAKNILINICSGNKEVTMDEIFEITEFVQEEAGYGTHLIWGNCFDENLGSALSVTIIATGFDSKMDNEKIETSDVKVKDNSKIFIPLENTNNSFDYRMTKQMGEAYNSTTENSKVFEFNAPKKNEVKNQSSELGIDRNGYKQQEKYQQLATQNKMNLNNKESISELENEPAYLRKGIRFEQEENDINAIFNETRGTRKVVDANSGELKNKPNYNNGILPD